MYSSEGCSAGGGEGFRLLIDAMIRLLPTGRATKTAGFHPRRPVWHFTRFSLALALFSTASFREFRLRVDLRIGIFKLCHGQRDSTCSTCHGAAMPRICSYSFRSFTPRSYSLSRSGRTCGKAGKAAERAAGLFRFPIGHFPFSIHSIHGCPSDVFHSPTQPTPPLTSPSARSRVFIARFVNNPS